MSDNRSNGAWICFLLVASLTTGPVIYAADDAPPAQPDKTVAIKSGSTTTQVKIQEADPYKHLRVPAPTDKYDPRSFSMNQTSSMANKGFSASSIAVSKNGTTTTAENQTGFAMKSFGNLNAADTHPTHSQYTPTGSSDLLHGDSQFNKNYATAHAAEEGNQTAAFSASSKEQNRSASIGGKKSEAYSSNLSKQYLGPGAQHVPDGLVKENVVINHVGDIPNRPLSIDEVRGLINHGFKPDLDATPDVPVTKALNDPEYKPEAAPETPSMMTPKARALNDDKDDPVPSPGTMSQPPPENSESLPQH